ncbi:MULTISPECIES: hypothetical protein [unclassified Pseudonocardia]|uniref:hypothetical protein n=1 Tax=Pseudonocardia TaxID=1847 RepID=UPI0011152C04|nr:hypothetical protein [Pseudonocardia sp. Ae707_Ps1]
MDVVSPSRSTSGGPSRGPMSAAAGTTMGALALDLMAGGHPVHVIALAGLVASATAFGHGLTPRGRAMVDVVTVLGLLQPAIHVVGGWTDSVLLATDAGSPLHEVWVAHEWTQVAMACLLCVAVVAGGRATDGISRLFRAAVVKSREALPEPAGHHSGVRTCRCGRVLRWCGWTLVAARRGPPLDAIAA